MKEKTETMRYKVTPPPPPVHQWIQQIFRAQAAKNGGIVRRKVSTVESRASAHDLEREVKRRGYHMIRQGDQFLIFCNTSEFKLIC